MVPGDVLAGPKSEKPEKTRSVMTSCLVFSCAVE